METIEIVSWTPANVALVDSSFIEATTTEPIGQIILKPALKPVKDVDYLHIKLDDKAAFLFIDGVVYKEYSLLAIREGFAKYNTPRGDFKALYKTENHLSSYFDVWMPYSIQFYGDYFLHGYPTYNDADRTPVPYGTSGGCIRMNTEDMKEIYKLVSIGMPIFIE